MFVVPSCFVLLLLFFKYLHSSLLIISAKPENQILRDSGLSGNVIKVIRLQWLKNEGHQMGCRWPSQAGTGQSCYKQAPQVHTICLRVPRWAQKNMYLCPSQEGETLPDNSSDVKPTEGPDPGGEHSLSGWRHIWLKNTAPNSVRSELSHGRQ